MLLCAPPASASGILGSGIGPSIGPDLNPLPSVGELLSSVVNGLFGALLNALTPSFLKHAEIGALEWLVAIPNVADSAIWPTVAHLEGDMMYVAGALLPTTLIVAAARDTALSLRFRASPAHALFRVLGAVFWLALYRFSFRFGVAFVNTLTHTMLSWPVVSQGLHRTVLVMFGSAAVFGVGGAFLGLLGLVALVFAICLFALKVFILSVLAILYVAGPLFLALSPLPAVGYLARGWLLAVVGVCLIPVGWCIVFATAGAISLDVTNLGAGAHIGSRIVGAFAALVTFYIAFRWPLMVLAHVRSAVGGLGVGIGGGGSHSAQLGGGALAAKAQTARTKLQAAMLAGGRGVGLAAGRLGAPRGGLAAAAGRQARPAFATAAVTGAIAAGPPAPRPRASALGERLARAGDELRAGSARMRDAWRTAGNGPATPGRASRRDRASRDRRTSSGSRAPGPSAPRPPAAPGSAGARPAPVPRSAPPSASPLGARDPRSPAGTHANAQPRSAATTRSGAERRQAATAPARDAEPATPPAPPAPRPRPDPIRPAPSERTKPRRREAPK